MKGAGAVAAAKASTIKVNANKRISETTGGKIAKAINETVKNVSNNTEKNTLSGSTNPGTDRQAERNAEVASFVNRSN